MRCALSMSSGSRLTCRHLARSSTILSAFSLSCSGIPCIYKLNFLECCSKLSCIVIVSFNFFSRLFPCSMLVRRLFSSASTFLSSSLFFSLTDCIFSFKFWFSFFMSSTSAWGNCKLLWSSSQRIFNSLCSLTSRLVFASIRTTASHIATSAGSWE